MLKGPAANSQGQIYPAEWRDRGEMTESAEGARLLSECTPKGVPRVRIPLSPPMISKLSSKKWSSFWLKIPPF